MKLPNWELTLYFGLLIGLVLNPIPRQAFSNDAFGGQAAEQKSGQNEKKPNSAATQDRKAPSGPESKNSSETSEEKQCHVIINYVPHKDGWDKVYIGATIVLAVIAGLTFAAVYYQARQTARAAEATSEAAKATRDSVTEIQRQAKAAEDAANAAKKSADALINIDRAWLIIESFTTGDDFWSRVRGASQYSGPKLPLSIDVKFLNCGHTPAWIVESAFDLLESTTVDKNLPINEHKKIESLMHHETVPVGGKGFEKKVGLRPATYISTPAMRPYELAEKFIYFYGYIKYRDVFEAQTSLLRETSWCYRLKFTEVPNNYPNVSWELCGPEGANKAT